MAQYFCSPVIEHLGYASLGQDYTALSGPREWTHDGKRLDEIRREIEEKSD
jgi:hypothetical protein